MIMSGGVEVIIAAEWRKQKGRVEKINETDECQAC